MSCQGLIRSEAPASAILATFSKVTVCCRGGDNKEPYPELPRCSRNQSRAAPLAVSKSFT